MTSQSDMPQVFTDFGWALAGFGPPTRKDLHWVKMPERHIYAWDDGGWHRIDPPENRPIIDKELPHG